ncbi:hypothetical protein [Amycolatopsis sp. NPDC051371]|uniref:hypothetical protein n=1 Tax=Amycolatopsis sp. NPDC051371 TaxID=3155800 RepID=UPI00341815D3
MTGYARGHHRDKDHWGDFGGNPMTIELLSGSSMSTPPSCTAPPTLSVPGMEKDALLVRSVTGDPHVTAEVRRRFRRRHAAAPAADTRTVGELLEAASARRTEREGVATARAAAEALLRDRTRAEVRELRLAALAADEESAWRKVAA